jgi:hypothetical protein
LILRASDQGYEVTFGVYAAKKCYSSRDLVRRRLIRVSRTKLRP